MLSLSRAFHLIKSITCRTTKNCCDCDWFHQMKSRKNKLKFGISGHSFFQNRWNPRNFENSVTKIRARRDSLLVFLVSRAATKLRIYTRGLSTSPLPNCTPFTVSFLFTSNILLMTQSCFKVKRCMFHSLDVIHQKTSRNLTSYFSSLFSHHVLQSATLDFCNFQINKLSRHGTVWFDLFKMFSFRLQ